MLLLARDSGWCFGVPCSPLLSSIRRPRALKRRRRETQQPAKDRHSGATRAASCHSSRQTKGRKKSPKCASTLAQFHILPLHSPFAILTCCLERPLHFAFWLHIRFDCLLSLHLSPKLFSLTICLYRHHPTLITYPRSLEVHSLSLSLRHFVPVNLFADEPTSFVIASIAITRFNRSSLPTKRAHRPTRTSSRTLRKRN